MTTNSHDRSVIGSRLEDLDSPALLLDWRVCERNLQHIASFFQGRSCQLRPHFKNHKCPTLARRQLEAGAAVGITCAKLGEAEVLAAHGFGDLLVANQVVGERKVARLIETAQQTRLTIAVDDLDQCKSLAAAAKSARVTVGVLIEVDIGMGRCGVPPGAPALALARELVRLPGIEFRGLQSYEGHVVYINDDAERARKTAESQQLAIDTKALIEKDGIEVQIVSGGASSTYQTVGAIPGFKEVQAGTYPTMDWRYREITSEFDIALSILARVISAPADRAVLDFGVKGAGGEFGPPRIKGAPEVEVSHFMSEEHFVVPNTQGWGVGDAVELLPSHACTTCNLHRKLIVHEDGRVIDVWPIEASGRMD